MEIREAMKTIPIAARQFGISQISVWQLIRTHGIKSKVSKRFGEVEVDTDQIKAFFDKNPKILERMRSSPK